MKETLFERKEAVLQAALDEFCSRSYEDASLNSILKNAGVSKGSFYYHFKDKKDLYFFMLKSAVEAKWTFIRNRLETQPDVSAGKDIFEQFRYQARIGAEFASKYPRHHRLSRMFSKEKGNAIYLEASAMLGIDAEGMLAGMIDAAIREGTFDATYSREFLIKTMGYLFSHFEEIFDKDEDFELDTMLRNLDLFVQFMAQGAAKPATR
jgi:AcrR family transcriptional regulator